MEADLTRRLTVPLVLMVLAGPAFGQEKDKKKQAPPAQGPARPRVEPTGGLPLSQVTQLRDQATRFRRDAEAFHVHASSGLRNADAALKSVSQGDSALKELGANPAFAKAVADIQASIAQQKEAEAKHRAAAKADQEQAAKLLAQAQDLEKKAADLEKPAPAPTPTPKTPAPDTTKPGTKPPGKG